MIATIKHKNEAFQIDLSKPLDISIPIDMSKPNINAWYLEDPQIKPVKSNNWTGNVAQGGPVNFNNIVFNPHAHITHTECVGHITEKIHSINKNLSCYFFITELITVEPQKQKNGDFVITKKLIKESIKDTNIEALVIRTIPNSNKKTFARYSNTNPPYLSLEAAEYIKNISIKHLLIDLPSVDKERDNGELLAHNAFWNTQKNIRFDATITEFIYVSNTIKDGIYVLNLMVAPFENDATPSKPILYKVEQVN